MSTTTPAPVQDHMLGNKAYDALKWIALILIPALATLYFTIAGIWGLPKANEVVGTLTALDTFLGLLLQLATKSYNNSSAQYDGSVALVPNADGQTSTLNLQVDPNVLATKAKIVLQGISPTPVLTDPDPVEIPGAAPVDQGK